MLMAQTGINLLEERQKMVRAAEARIEAGRG
jgi:hypothetical protein